MTRLAPERFGPIDFDRFHREELPALLALRGAVFSDSDAAVVRPLAFQLSDGRAYTYVPDGTTFSVQPGTADAHTIVELAPDAWTAFAWELKTCFALLYADQLTVRQGSFGQVARWEPPLRVALSDQVLFDIDTPVRIDDEDGPRHRPGPELHPRGPAGGDPGLPAPDRLRPPPRRARRRRGQLP